MSEISDAGPQAQGSTGIQGEEPLAPQVPKLGIPELVAKAIEAAQALAGSMPDTPAANRLRVWMGGAQGLAPQLEFQRAQWEEAKLMSVASGSEEAFWMRMEPTRGGGNGAGLAEFGRRALELWKSAPDPESAQRAVEICADASWRAVAARFYARQDWEAAPERLDRQEGIELMSRSAFEARQDMLGLKRTLAAAMCLPWMGDAKSLGMSSSAAREQAALFRAAAAQGLSGSYRAKPEIGMAKSSTDNPVSEWAAAGFAPGALKAKLASWRACDPLAGPVHATLTTRY